MSMNQQQLDGLNALGLLEPAISRRLPEYVLKQFGGKARNFRRFHRIKLRAALRALSEARHGCAFTGDSAVIDAAQQLLEQALQHCAEAAQ